MNAEEALADLMSVIDVSARRDLVASDISLERKYACIDRLSLSLVLAIPFGKDRHWRRLRRHEFPQYFTNVNVNHLLKEDDRSLIIIEYFDGRMGKQRFEELRRKVEAFQSHEDVDIAFQFTFDELNQIDSLMAVELGRDLGGEVFWSYDTVKAPSGAELEFVFAMLNRNQLISCVAGPYEDADDLDPGDYGLTDLDD